jgi:hypothetical protein
MRTFMPKDRECAGQGRAAFPVSAFGHRQRQSAGRSVRSWKRRQAAKLRARELREAAEVVEAMEAAAEAAVAEKGFEVMNRSDDAVVNPTLKGQNEQAIVWHPRYGYMPIWQARSLDKAAINDATYPAAAPSDASCEEPGAERRDKALDVAKALVARDADADVDEDEQRALVQIVEVLARLDERLTALEQARAERLTLDAEVEALKCQPALH